MPTLKQRINLAVPFQLCRTLTRIAKRDHTSVATKTLNLVRLALEIEEDAFLLSQATQREQKKVRFVSHEKAWV